MAPVPSTIRSGPDVPQPAFGPVPRPSLDDEHVAVVVDPEGRRSREDLHAFDGLDDGPFVDEEHPAVQLRRGRLPPRRTAADHERFDVDELPVESPAILSVEAASPGERPRVHPVRDLDDRRPQRRLADAVRPANLDDRVRLLRACGEHAARSAAVDAMANDLHVVRQQGRGDGVAGKALVHHVVEPEPDTRRAVDAGPTLGEPHSRNSWVTVSRVATNQRRQPAEWTQRSRNGPFGLSRMKTYSTQPASSTASGSCGYSMPACPP